MTADEFRAIALGLPEAVEFSHMNHPDFRVGGKIFATLGYPGREWGCVSLTPAEQARVCRAEPKVFVRVKGAWGGAGATQVCLDLARKRSVQAALKAAWRNRAWDEDEAGEKKPTRKAISKSVKKSRPRRSGATPASRRTSKK